MVTAFLSTFTKRIEGGISWGIVFVKALNALARPELTIFDARDVTGCAVRTIRCFTWAGVSEGSTDHNNAAIPVTCGADIEVPNA